MRLARVRGNFSRTGTLMTFSTMRSTTSVAATSGAASLAMASGWATLHSVIATAFTPSSSRWKLLNILDGGLLGHVGLGDGAGDKASPIIFTCP